MERSIFASIFSGLLGIVTLGGLVFVHPVPDRNPDSQPAANPSSPPAPQPKPEGDWRILDPVTYENISVFPVVASYGQDTSAFLTLEEGLASGEVLVRERGSVEMVRGRSGHIIYLPQTTGASVNQLVLVNRSKRPLLLLAGERSSGRTTASTGCFLRRAWPLDRQRAIRCGRYHCASERTRKGRSGSGPDRSVGRGSQWFHPCCTGRRASPENLREPFASRDCRQCPHRSL
ncbi:MAG: hypothetical protein DMG40_17970 [Acidobacteria bacterium]|nr:MAG: hypothetical protein DMG40_17970 [Acidobacteriota bacterium]